tara:strand:- start:13646 stop:14113 length:468 start_codon:yes stop_codon:yes gene_type:complete
MDFHTANMIDSLQSGDITRFKQDFEQKMNELIVSKIEDKKSLVMQSVQEEEGDEGPKVDGGEDDTIFADPAMSKEYFLKTFEHEGHEITLKKLGLGPTKPVVVHVDGKRWELFPGPKVAEKQAKEYVATLKEKKPEETDEEKPSEDEKNINKEDT